MEGTDIRDLDRVDVNGRSGQVIGGNGNTAAGGILAVRYDDRDPMGEGDFEQVDARDATRVEAGANSRSAEAVSAQDE